MDFEPIEPVAPPPPVKKCKSRKRRNHHGSKVKERDDLSGMLLNMFGKIDMRELFIIWIAFIIIHTEKFAEQVLKRFSGAINDDGTMRMKGTLYSSACMILVVILCTIVF